MNTQRTLPQARCETCGMQLESFRYQRSNEDWRIQGGWVVERICQFCLPREYMNARNEVLASNSRNGTRHGTYGTHRTDRTDSPAACRTDGCNNETDGFRYCERCLEEMNGKVNAFCWHVSNAAAWCGIVAFMLAGAWIIHQWIGG